MNYSYNTNTFTGSNGTWKLIGTDGTARLGKDSIDTFRNTETGEYVEMVRWKVYKMEKAGKIKPFSP